MKTKLQSGLKTKLLAGAALAAASLTAQAGTEVAPYFYTWAFGANNYAVNSLAQAQAAGIDAVTRSSPRPTGSGCCPSGRSTAISPVR